MTRQLASLLLVLPLLGLLAPACEAPQAPDSDRAPAFAAQGQTLRLERSPVAATLQGARATLHAPGGAALQLGAAALQRRGGADPSPDLPWRLDAHGCAARDASPEALERLCPHPEGVEQTWSFAAAPSGQGPLEVAVPADGLRLIGADSSGLLLAGDQGGLRYSHATWIDARGQRTPLRVALRDGALRMVVPEATLRDTAWPAVLDPVVSPLLETDTDPQPLREVANAWDARSQQWLVVYTRGVEEPAVFGQLFKEGPCVPADPLTCAEATSPIFAISPRGVIADQPAVASDGNSSFLVAYHTDAQRVFTIPVDAAGNVGAASLASDPERPAEEPALAYAPQEELFITTFSTSIQGKIDIFGRFVQLAQGPQGGAFAINQSDGNKHRSAATWYADARLFAVAWDNNATRGVHVALVNPSSGQVGADNRLGDIAELNDQPDLACTTGGFPCVVVWRANNSNAPFIAGRPFTAQNLSVVPEGNSRRLADDPQAHDNPSITRHNDARLYSLAWRYTVDSAQRIYGMEISAFAEPQIDPFPISSDESEKVGPPDLAWNGDAIALTSYPIEKQPNTLGHRLVHPDNASLPGVSVNNTFTIEGAGAQATFTVSLSAPSTQTVTVTARTQDDTALAGEDYTANLQTLTFAPGQTSRTFTVNLLNDARFEVDEELQVRLSNPINAVIDDGVGIGTIFDEDPMPSIAVADVEIHEPAVPDTANLTFTATLSAPAGATVTLPYFTQNGTAVAPADYTATSGTLTLPPGTTTASFNVVIQSDSLSEANEVFNVNLGPATNASLPDSSAQGTIRHNGALPQLSIDDVTVTEGSLGGVGNAAFTLRLSAASGQTVTVRASTANGTATAGPDYDAFSNATLTFAPGVTEVTAFVGIRGDNLDESDETFTVQLFNPTNATLLDDTGLGTILDDDATPSLRISDLTVAEGDAGQNTPHNLTVRLSAASGLPVTVELATSGGNAAAGLDYNAVTTSLTFNPGVTQLLVPVTILGDNLDEDDETFNARLSNPSNATLADDTGVVTLTDDDATPSLRISDASVAEGSSGQTTPATFDLTLSAPSGRTVTVSASTVNGTAAAPADFTALTGASVTFAPGQTTRQLSVNVLGDDIAEPNETFTLRLSAPSNATLADADGLGTIANDDGTPVLRVSDATAAEGGSATFTVSIAPASAQPVSFTWRTRNGTAAAPGDYTAVTNGAGTIPAGQTSTTFTVQTTADTIDEDDELFQVELLTASGANLADPLGDATITDDDAPPVLTLSDLSITEANVGIDLSIAFNVNLSAPSGLPVTVNVATADGTATAGLDYDAVNLTLTFQPGTTNLGVLVTILGDNLDEDNETFTARLSNPGNATILDDTGVGTITDNDAPPSLSISDASVAEGNTGDAALPFTVTLSAPSGKTVTATVATSNGTAAAPGDYDALNTTVTFAPGQTSRTVQVNVHGDTLDEADETFNISLTAPITNASLNDNLGVGTLLDDDAPPSLSVANLQLTEGADANATFTLTLSAPSGQTAQVRVRTNDGTALAGSDYTALGSTLITFNPGQTTRTVQIPLLHDTLDEGDETFTLELSNPSQLTLAQPRATATIRDNDAPPTVGVSETVSAGEGSSATLTFTASAASGLPITINWGTDDGTALAGSDYTTVNNATVTIPPGATSATVTVQTLDDALDEANESFSVRLLNAQNATLRPGDATVTILDNDPTPSVTATAVQQIEGDTGLSDAVVQLRLSAPSGQTVSLRARTVNGTAQAGSDFNAVDLTVTFPPGQQDATVAIPLRGDTTDEANETLQLAFTEPLHVTLAVPQVSVTILNDDGAPTLSIADVTVAEGDNGTRDATFTVQLLPASGQTVTVAWSTADADARAGLDYEAASGTLTFAPGQTTRPLNVAILGDALDESDEALQVRLSAPTNATLANVEATATILDDDAPPVLTLGDLAFDEGSHRHTIDIPVTLLSPSGLPVTVQWRAESGTALEGEDFEAASGALTLAPGDLSATITVTILGDALSEADEVFQLVLSSPINATLGDASGAITLRDDDDAPALSVEDASASEDDAGGLVFAVTLAAPAGRAVEARVTTASEGAAGQATPGLDFTALDTTVRFEPGEQRAEVRVEVLDDALYEAPEALTLQLSALVGANPGRLEATGTILDDDDAPQVTAEQITAAEPGADDLGTVSVTLRLSEAAGQPIVVRWATGDGTATADRDYTAVAEGEVTFEPGAQEATLQVTLLPDAIDEEDEGFALLHDGGLGAEAPLTLPLATITILDDDAPPILSALALEVQEPRDGESTTTLELTLSAPSERVVLAALRSQDGSAAAGLDYGALEGVTIRIEPGQTTAQATLTILGDALEEGPESFLVEVVPEGDLATAAAPATVTILDDPFDATVAELQLALEQKGEATPHIGGELELEVRVENIGTAALPGPVEVTLSVPDGLIWSSDDAEEGWECALEAGEGDDATLRCTVTGALAAGGGSATASLTFEVGEAAWPQTTVTAAAAAEGAPLEATASLDIVVNGAVDLALSLEAGAAQAVPGDALTWTITLTNAGPLALDAAILTAQLPAAVTEPRFTPARGVYDAASGAWTGLALSQGEEVTLEVSATVTEEASGVLELGASVTPADPTLIELNPADNADAVTTPIVALDGDCDGDGLSDAEEAELGTLPCEADSDSDGLDDGIEVNGANPTDPSSPDSDQDGACDGPAEVPGVCLSGEDLNANGRVDAGETDPNNPDSDGGGVLDGDELRAGLDPLDNTDDPATGSSVTREDCGCSTPAATPRWPLGALLLTAALGGIGLLRRR